MNKAELMREVAKRTDYLLKDTETIVEGLLEVIQEQLSKGDSVLLREFGAFNVLDRKATKARNPKTGEEIDLPARKAPKFTASQKLKDLVNGK